MLGLVFTHRHFVGVVQENVRGHEDRIVEETGADGLLAFALFLELGHPPQLADGGHTVEDPRQLGNHRDMTLYEQGAAQRIQTTGEQQRREANGLRAEIRRVVRDRHGVQIHDTEDAVVLLVHPPPDRPDVIAEMHLTGRLDPRKLTSHRPKLAVLVCPSARTVANQGTA